MREPRPQQPLRCLNPLTSLSSSSIIPSFHHFQPAIAERATLCGLPTSQLKTQESETIAQLSFDPRNSMVRVIRQLQELYIA